MLPAAPLPNPKSKLPYAEYKTLQVVFSLCICVLLGMNSGPFVHARATTLQLSYIPRPNKWFLQFSYLFPLSNDSGFLDCALLWSTVLVSCTCNSSCLFLYWLIPALGITSSTEPFA
jgi:hypothetical protein